MSNFDELKSIISAMTYPRHVDALKSPDATIHGAVIGSYAPEAPPIIADVPVACIGSCFAEEIAKSLAAQGKSVVPLRLSERWNTPFAVRFFLEFCLDNKPFPDGFLSSVDDANEWMVDRVRSCGAFIITLGLSLCWFEMGTNRMVMDIKGGHGGKMIAKALTTHTMRQTSVAENVTQINAIIETIRRSNATAPIIFTLSPIPLMLSVTDYPPVASNTISKATLRVALHEIMERQLEGVFYWPSYEIVEWVGKYLGLIWGQDGNDLRHLQSSLIDAIMQRFAKVYFTP